MPIVKVNDINMYYETYGEGEPLVLVTGFTAELKAWQNIIRTYAAKYQVIVFDNRGIGKTDCPDFPYSTTMMADDTVGLLKALNLKSAHFIGASFGGCIVQEIAYKYPELVKSIVLSCSFPKWNMRVKLYAEARHEFMQKNAPDEAIVKFITLLTWSEKFLSKPGMAEQLVRGGAHPITLTGYVNQMHAVSTFDSTAWLNKIKCPCLVLSGEDDILISADNGVYMAEQIPNAEFYCFKDAGHLPYIEQPEIFNELVMEFLDKN